MPAVTITLEDTPDGGVQVTSDYRPNPGQPCSAAQTAALDIVNRTRRHWDVAGSTGRSIKVNPIAQATAVAEIKALGQLTTRGRGGPA